MFYLPARFRVEFQRAVDHFWLFVRGMSSVKRSMLTRNLFLGGQYSVRNVKSLQKLGVTAIVNMRMGSESGGEDLSSFKVVHLPTKDREAPSIAQLEEGSKFIADEIAQGGTVYIHCRWGEGRAPTMASAYLIFTGMSFGNAFDFVKRVRTFIRPTEEQIARLKEFEGVVREREALVGM